MNPNTDPQPAERPSFSFEVLPPLKGTGTEALWRTIDRLSEFDPRYINITTHRSEYVYREVEGGLLQRHRIRRRPGTVAVAAAIQQRYGINAVPHIVCSGLTREQIEYMLLDLQFLGIDHLLLLRGDKARDEARFIPTPDGHAHALDLIDQVNRFNSGHFDDGTPIPVPGRPFRYGVACYPEKHDEAPNPEADLDVLRRKAEAGAGYAVTQLFYDNRKYFDFVRRAREAGITIPIIPGIKPLAKMSQLAVVPKTFHCDLPPALATEAARCTTDAQVAALGVEWAVQQCRELLQSGVEGLHFYTVSAVESIAAVAKEIY